MEMSYTFKGQSREKAYSSIFQATGSVLLQKVLSQRDSARVTAPGLALREQAQCTESGLLVLLHTQAWGRGSLSACAGAWDASRRGPSCIRGCPSCPH